MRFQKKKWMKKRPKLPVCRCNHRVRPCVPICAAGWNKRRQPCFEPFRASFRGLGTDGFQAEPQGRKV